MQPPPWPSSKIIYHSSKKIYPIPIEQFLSYSLSTWHIPICFLSLWIYLFCIFHMNGIIQYVALYLASVIYIKHSLVCTYHVLFNHSSVDGHVGYFYVLGYCDTYCCEWVVTCGIWVPIFSDSLWYFVKYVTVSLHLDNFEFLSLYFSVMREFKMWTQTYFQCGLIEIIKAWSLIFTLYISLLSPQLPK